LKILKHIRYEIFDRLSTINYRLSIIDYRLTYEHGQTKQFGVLHTLRGKVQTCLRVNLSDSTLCID